MLVRAFVNSPVLDGQGRDHLQRDASRHSEVIPEVVEKPSEAALVYESIPLVLCFLGRG